MGSTETTPISIAAYLPQGSNLGIGNYTAGRAKCVNVLLVGRTQTGKSTIVETILQPQSGTGGTGFSITKNPACNTLILKNEGTGATYQLNIIDTPGLKEVREEGESRLDSELLKLATKCVGEQITTLNVVCFVSRAGETHLLDTEVFKIVKECLGKAYSRISMMVLTHCDEYDDETVSQFEATIRAHEVSKPYAEYCELGIFRFGAINYNKLKGVGEHLRAPTLQDKLERIEKWRGNILDKITSCADNPIKVSELEHIYKAGRNAIRAEAEKLSKQNREEAKSNTSTKLTGFCSTH